MVEDETIISMLSDVCFWRKKNLLIILYSLAVRVFFFVLVLNVCMYIVHIYFDVLCLPLYDNTHFFLSQNGFIIIRILSVNLCYYLLDLYVCFLFALSSFFFVFGFINSLFLFSLCVLMIVFFFWH